MSLRAGPAHELAELFDAVVVLGDPIVDRVIDLAVAQAQQELDPKLLEIARGVAFLVDENAGFVTGSTLSINGGQHMY